MHAALWGTDHEELGRIASSAAGDRAAVALTRGRYPKAYRYEDPNEDAVAAVAGPRATLLVCADGHNGATASHIAVREVLAAVGEDPPEAFSDAEWLELFGAVNEAVRAAKGLGSAQPASNTVLLTALVSPGRLSFAAIGDAALVVCRPGAGRGRQLNKEAMRFIGHPMNGRALKSTVQRGTAPVDAADWVVLATDGLSGFIAPRRPADVLPRLLTGSAQEAAVAIVETACSAGAGDNVGVALIAP